MMNIFTFTTNFLFLLEFLGSIYLAFRIFRYVYKNRIYSRDVLLLTPCLLLNVLSLAVVYKFDYLIIVRQIILIESVISFFIVSNIRSSNTKWLSNIFNSITTSFLVISLVYDSIVFYQVNIISLICINFLFILINKDSKIFTTFDILSNLCSLFLIMTCYFLNRGISYNHDVLVIFTLIFNFIIIAHITYRLKVLNRIFKKGCACECSTKNKRNAKARIKKTKKNISKSSKSLKKSVKDTERLEKTKRKLKEFNELAFEGDELVSVACKIDTNTVRMKD